MSFRLQTKIPSNALLQWNDGKVSRLAVTKIITEKSAIAVGNQVQVWWENESDIHDCEILYLHDDATVLLEKEREFLKDPKAFKEKLVTGVKRGAKDKPQRIPKASVKRRLRNIDSEQEAGEENSNREPMFDIDTVTEQENEEHMRNTVDQLVTESLSKEPDEAHSQSAGVGVSNDHLVTLVSQNLAMTNEILTRVKAIENCQFEMLRTIDHLVNPVVDLTPHGVSEHPEPLLTIFNQGMPAQPQLNLIPQQNVSPVFPHSATEQLPYLGEYETINQNDLRDGSVPEAHPERGAAEMDINSLQEIKDASCSGANFAVNLLRKYFTDEELKGRNVSGLKGKQALDLVKMQKIKQYFFQMYPCSEGETEKDKWSKATDAICSYIRGRFAERKKKKKAQVDSNK